MIHVLLALINPRHFKADALLLLRFLHKLYYECEAIWTDSAIFKTSKTLGGE